MLLEHSERPNEIGMRKAFCLNSLRKTVGTLNRDVLLQLLMETLMISSLGVEPG